MLVVQCLDLSSSSLMFLTCSTHQKTKMNMESHFKEEKSVSEVHKDSSLTIRMMRKPTKLSTKMDGNILVILDRSTASVSLKSLTERKIYSNFSKENMWPQKRLKISMPRFKELLRSLFMETHTKITVLVSLFQIRNSSWVLLPRMA